MDLSFDFWMSLIIGFCAQMVDGALGMAYGTLSAAFLISLGMAPAFVSASVHTAQFFTTGISAASHSYFKNVDWKLCALLAVGGIFGGVAGALVLSSFDGKMMRPFVSAYLLLLGFSIIWKFFNVTKKPTLQLPQQQKFVPALGLFGGFFDAIGGGGWGPIVTSNLIAQGGMPRMVIGSVNTAEFFVKTAIALAFFMTLGFQFHTIVLALLIGGVIAAPLGAFVLRYINSRYLMLGVGVLITLLSLVQIFNAVFT